MMDAGRMAPYVGFTEAEVHDLFARKEKEGMLRLYQPKRKYCRSSLLLYLDYGRKAIALEAETAGLVLYLES